MLFWLIFLPLFGGLIGWIAGTFSQRFQLKRVNNPVVEIDSKLLSYRIKNELIESIAILIALVTMVSCFIIAAYLAVQALMSFNQGHEWLETIDFDWIPLLGIRFHLVADGLSILMILLTLFIVIVAIIYSCKEKPHSSGLFYCCLLFMASAVMTFFVVKDLFLLCFVWEAVTIPFYFMITLWGRRDSSTQLKFNGANKFLIFTQISSLFMLISVISLALANWQLTNHWTFDYFVLSKTPISSYVEFLLMLGFLLAFIVRIPLVPFHGGVLDAHIESSTTGSILISGVLINTAVYGLMNFIMPLFPNASQMIMPVMFILSLLTLFYAALLCFSQNDIKRLIAYIHMALMGFIIAILYSGSLLAHQGIIIQLIGVSLAIVGLFIIGGLLVERYLTRNITQFSGLKSQVRYLSTLTIFFVLTILGLPGSANFVGTMMMLLGTYQVSGYIVLLALFGLLLLAVSIVIRIQPIFYNIGDKPLKDKQPLSIKDLLLLSSILFLIFFIGLYPQWILDMSYFDLNRVQQTFEHVQLAAIKGDS